MAGLEGFLCFLFVFGGRHPGAHQGVKGGKMGMKVIEKENGLLNS